jgi:hypothetical protein
MSLIPPPLPMDTELGHPALAMEEHDITLLPQNCDKNSSKDVLPPNCCLALVTSPMRT